jgi:hypothetical protein
MSLFPRQQEARTMNIRIASRLQKDCNLLIFQYELVILLNRIMNWSSGPLWFGENTPLTIL